MTPRGMSLLLLLILARSISADGVDREKLNPVLGSVLKVEVISPTGAYSLGSAVSIAPGRFVTNCHVTAPAEHINLIYQDLHWPVLRQSSDPAHDICVLDAPALKAISPVSRRSSNSAKVGQPVVAIGYTFGAGLHAEEGTITALNSLDGGVVIRTTTGFNSGASGGGLFDADGNLIGILTFHLPGAVEFYFSIPSDWIAANTDDSNSYESIAPIVGPVPFWARPNLLKPWFMRATTLEAAENWHGLIILTDDWSAAEQDSADPWLARGQAYAHLDRTDAAIKAFRQAVKLKPDLAIAWFELGVACTRRRMDDEAAIALAHLKSLDIPLAEKLAHLDNTSEQQ